MSDGVGMLQGRNIDDGVGVQWFVVIRAWRAASGMVHDGVSGGDD
jgi:hypothetical protein